MNTEVGLNQAKTTVRQFMDNRYEQSIFLNMSQEEKNCSAYYEIVELRKAEIEDDGDIKY